MKRIILLFCVMCLLLAGCSVNNESASDKLVVGFSQLGAESGWRIANTKSVERAAISHGYGLMMDNANQKQEKQIAAIRSFISYRVDVIVFSPIVEDGWDNVLNEARSAGIPVILVDRMIKTKDDSLYAAYIGADFYTEGHLAGEYLIRKADELGVDHLNIVQIAGNADSTPMLQRQRGFLDAIADDSRLTIVDSICGDFLRSKGQECAAYLLDKHGQDGIQVIFSHNDSMTYGAISVLEQNGVQPGKDVIMISVDGEKEAVNLLKDGKINCIVQCTPDLGEDVMALVASLKSGIEVPKITHPHDGVYCDFDDLTAPGLEGF